MDKELLEQLKLIKGTKSTDDNPMEYDFISKSLMMGFSINDIKELDYVDIAKIMICSIPEDKKYKKATAADWDKLM